MRLHSSMRLLIASMIVLGLAPSVSSRSAAGSAFGALTTAAPQGHGAANVGFGVGLADATSFTGTLTYGLSQYMDGRLRLGLIDPDGGDTEFTFGADFKWQFWNAAPESTHPFDFAVGGLLEYADFVYSSVFQIGGHLIASYPIALDKGGSLVPYGRFNTRIESMSFDSPVVPPESSGDGDSDTNLEVGLNAGVQWICTPTTSLFGEIQLDGNDGLFLGVDFNIM